MIKITIDTSVIADQKQSVLQRLVDFHRNKVLDVAVSNRFEMDKENDTNVENKLRQQSIVQIFNEISSPFRISTDRIIVKQDHGILAGNEIYPQLYCLFNIDTNKRGGVHYLWDVDHIYGHLVDKRDFFLTYDDTVLRKRETLKEIHVNVSNPDRFVWAVDEANKFHNPKSSKFKGFLHTYLDSTHDYPKNPQLLKKLSAIKKAQLEIKDNIITQDDEKVIASLAMQFKMFNQYPPDIALLKARVAYPRMKATYVARCAIYGLKPNEIIRGLRQIYNETQ